MARYERKEGSNLEVPLAYFDRKSIGADTASRAAFAQAVTQAFPRNTNLQRALTDYAGSKGRFIVDSGRVKIVGKKEKAIQIKARVLSGKNKGKPRPIKLQTYLKRKSVKTALETGKKTIYLSSLGVASLKTPAQAAAYRRASKNPPALIDWNATAKKGIIVFA